tara:strand:+ start:5323 stop:5625 length:303 start_codon:yes stop_codon:yes gene_type:complete
MTRCDYCGRFLFKNVSGQNNLCSNKCKSKFKNKNLMIKLETIVFSNMVNGITSKEMNKIVLVDKYDLISAVRRLVYFDKKLSIKTNDEINQLTKLFIKKK